MFYVFATWLWDAVLHISPQTLLIIVVKHRVKEQQGKTDKEEILKWGLRICSENNFPTAAGLASSAAGYACLGTNVLSFVKLHVYI